MNQVSINILPDASIPLWVQSPDYITSVIQKYGCWEPNITHFFISLLKHDPSLSFCDVGAHFGYYSVIHREFCPSLRRLAIEPNPLMHFKGPLRANLQPSEVLMAAIGNGDPIDYGIARNGNSGGSGELVLIEAFELDTMKLTALPTFDIYKIDVEGGEYKVLNSLCESRRLPETALYIFIEVSPSLNFKSATDTAKLLVDNGYYVYDLGLHERGAYHKYPIKPLDWNDLHSCRQTNLFAAKYNPHALLS